MAVSARDLANIRLRVTPSLSITKATQAEAEAGTDDRHYMTALKTAQEIAAKAPPLISERINRRRLFRRLKQYQVPLTPGAAQDVLAGLGGVRAQAYPTSLTINTATSELWTLHGWENVPSGSMGVVFCYDISGGEFPALKYWFRTGQWGREGIKYLEHDGKKWLYTLGDSKMIRFDITSYNSTPPTPGSVVTPETVYSSGPDGYHQSAWCGDHWAISSGSIQNPGGQKNKTRFVKADRDMVPFSEFNFELTAMGTYQTASQEYFAKTQGTAWWNGQFWHGVGGIVRTPDGNPAGSGNFDLQSRQQGIAVSDGTGRLVEMAVCRPETAFAVTGTMVGRTIRLHENEGITVDETTGDIYALWMISHPDEWTTLGRTLGIVITKEYSADDAASDYFDGATAVRYPFDQRSGYYRFAYGDQIKHPLTQTALTTLDQIIDMMIACHLREVDFSTYNSPVTDINGVALGTNNAFVNIKLVVNAACDVTLSYYQGGTYRFRVTNIGGPSGAGSRVQVNPLSADDTTGAAWGGAVAQTKGDPVSDSLTGYRLLGDGGLSIYRTAGTPLNISRGSGSDGYIAGFYTGTGVIGGIYRIGTDPFFRIGSSYIGKSSSDPEGVLAMATGSLIVRSDAPVTHLKASGTTSANWLRDEGPTSATGLTATGANQAAALGLTALFSVLSTVTSGTGVRLRAEVRNEQVVKNNGANAVLVYPPVGGALNGGATNAAVSLAAGAVGRYLMTSSTVGHSL